MISVVRCFIVLLLLQLGTGCATTAEGEANVDPFERSNRAVFRFNDGLDRMVLEPVAKGYNWVTPVFVQRGVRNFFSNIYDLNGAINAGLQGQFVEMLKNTGRFLVNSSVGMFGFVDIASEMGIGAYRTDFGHTLATWGARPGPYLMVPFFGPRTVRSGAGTMFDTLASPQWTLDRASRSALFGLEVIENRAALESVDDLITGDRYVFVRDAYLQQRKYFVSGGVVTDNFSEFEEDIDWEE